MSERGCIRGKMRRVWFTPRIIPCWLADRRLTFPSSDPQFAKRQDYGACLDDLQRKLAGSPCDDAKGANGVRCIQIRGDDQISRVGIEGALEIERRRRVLAFRMGVVDPEMLQRFGARASEKREELLGGDLVSLGALQGVLGRQNGGDEAVAAAQQTAALDVWVGASFNEQKVYSAAAYRDEFFFMGHRLAADVRVFSLRPIYAFCAWRRRNVGTSRSSGSGVDS